MTDPAQQPAAGDDPLAKVPVYEDWTMSRLVIERDRAYAVRYFRFDNKSGTPTTLPERGERYADMDLWCDYVKPWLVDRPWWAFWRAEYSCVGYMAVYVSEGSAVTACATNEETHAG